MVAVRAEADERELSLERALELPRGEAGGVRLGEVRVKSVAPPAYVFGQNIFQCDVSNPPLTPHVWQVYPALGLEPDTPPETFPSASGGTCSLGGVGARDLALAFGSGCDRAEEGAGAAVVVSSSAAAAAAFCVLLFLCFFFFSTATSGAAKGSSATGSAGTLGGFGCFGSLGRCCFCASFSR